MNEVLDFCIIITTYNRPQMLSSLIHQIKNQTKDKKIKIYVLDDNSLKKLTFNDSNITFINFYPNRGKKLFWQIINVAFNLVKNIQSKYFIFLQDDQVLVENFFKIVVDKYMNLLDERKICLEFRTDERTTRPNWSNFKPIEIGDYIKTQWVELDFICEKKFFEVLNYEILPVNKNRWKKNPNLSSGVGQQLTNRLNSLGLNMYHTKNTLVRHGNHKSEMNEIERNINKLIS